MQLSTLSMFILQDMLSFPGLLSATALNSQREQVSRFITSHVSAAQLKQDTQQVFVYVLPDTCVKRGAFQKFFSALEKEKEDLGIDSYGLTDTTLEEVSLDGGGGAGHIL